jgi:hypothetical protein
MVQRFTGVGGMNNTNTGGPAFPQTEVDRDGVTVTQHSGMTLRDYFAAKAMQSLIAGSFTEIGQEGIEANRQPFQNIEDLMSETSYKYADAMLKAREA